MTHTFKLARRIARLRSLFPPMPLSRGPRSLRSWPTVLPVLTTAALVLTSACTDPTDELTSTTPADTGDASLVARGKRVASLVLTPDTVSVVPGETTRFVANVVLADGSTGSQAVSYRSLHGTIDSSGSYTTDQPSGTDTVIAMLTTGGPADSSTIRITAGASGSACASTATSLCPGDDLQAKAKAAGSGATLTLRPGVYRMQSVTPLSGQTIQGQSGAVVSGARLLSGWVRSGATWYVTGQTQEFTHSIGVCESGTACQYPEDVYRDNQLLHRELSLSAVGPGDFYFDYGANRIYVGDDPAGHSLEAAAVAYAFLGSASNVTIRGLVIEKYATPAQDGAIGKGGTGGNWTIRDNEIRYNHGGGVRGANGAVVVDNYVHHNGQIGVVGDFARVDSNEIAYNNTSRFRSDWEAGGTKFLWTTNLLVRGNFSHHNRGVGLWTDTGNTGTVFDGNRVEDNTWMGIHHETSNSARITNNTIRRNGSLNPNSAEGAGIVITCSGGTGIDISRNTLTDNKNAIVLLQADRGASYVTKNVSVHDNFVTLKSGERIGAHRYGGNTGLWTSNNNHFEHNTYYLQSAMSAPFMWQSANRTDSQWRGYGNDDSGTFDR